MATDFLIPNTATGIIGEARAITLMRQCMATEPLSVQESFCLKNVKCLSKSRSSVLYLLCHSIGKTSNSYPFLYTDPKESVISDEYIVT